MQLLPPFRLVRARTLAEATAALAADPAARVLAGGTDLVVNLRRGLATPSALVDLSGVDGLNVIESGGKGMRIGARVTLERLAADERIRNAYPAIAQAAAGIAGPTHRTVATLGGNLCLDTRCVFYNQSEWWRRANRYCLKYRGDTCHVAPQAKSCQAAYSGDLAPVLLVLGAEAEIAAAGGSRRIALADMYVEDGAAHLALRPGEILAAVHVPTAAATWSCAYRKARARAAMDFPLAGVAVALRTRAGRVESLRIAVTGTNARPLLVTGTEELSGAAADEKLLAAVAKLVQHQVRPLRTTVTAANYRRQVAAVLAQRLVRELAASSRPN